MNIKDWTISAFLIIAILFALAIGTAASNYSAAETAKVAFKEGYCSKLVKEYILWEKCK